MEAKELKEIRAALKLTQEELADRLHVCIRQYQRYEWGEYLMPKIREDLLRSIYKEVKKGTTKRK